MNGFTKCLMALVAVAIMCMARPAAASPRTVVFHLGAQCLCAQCGFDAVRILGKFDGVQKTTLFTKERHMDIVFDEAKQPLSALALAVSHLDLGDNSSLAWPIDQKADPTQAAKALEKIPGVHAAKANAKDHTVLLTFTSKAPVSASQLDSALKGTAAHA